MRCSRSFRATRFLPEALGADETDTAGIMRNTWKGILLFAVIAAPVWAQVSTLTPARFVKSRSVVLGYNSVQPVDQVEVFASHDAGRTWEPVRIQNIHQGSVEVHATHEGRNDFFLVLHNAAGASSGPPETGTAAHASVVLDTRIPIVQLHECAVQPLRGDEPFVHLRMNIIEEHLAAGGVRVFVRRGAATPWQDAGALAYSRDSILHPLPRELAQGMFDLRLVITDQAGNRTMEDRLGLSVPRPAPVLEPQPQNAGRMPETPRLPPMPEVVEPDPRLYRLRQLGQSHFDRQEYDLAEARISEALDLAPADADLLSDMGWIQIQTQRMEPAAKTFQAALDQEPEHLKSIEGLALVLARQHKYSGADKLFKRYLRLAPQSPRMLLHYGDNLHRLGESRQAEDAWEKVFGADADLLTAKKAQDRLRLLRGS